jgi:hypothetical protein
MACMVTFSCRYPSWEDQYFPFIQLNFIGKPKKINTIQVHFNTTKLQPLGHTFQAYKKIEMSYYTIL